MIDADATADFPGQDGFQASDAMRLATRYLARYAASSHHMRQVLGRQIRRWHQRRDLPLPDAQALDGILEGTLTRLRSSGLLDDAAFGLARARSLASKGLPSDAIRRRLTAEGLDARAEALDEVIVADDAVQARRYAERKRLGPFRRGTGGLSRDKDVRRLIRAGFSFRVAVAVIDGPAQDGDDRDS